MPRFMYIGGAQIPITPPATDPFFSNVKLLMGFEGADGSTTFVDESSVHHTMTANGNVQIDTAQQKFGLSSGLFDGSGDYLTCPRADFNFNGLTQFTIETFIRFNSLATGTNQGDAFLAHWSVGSFGWHFGRRDADASEIRLRTSSNGSTVSVDTITSGAGITTGVWYHICAERDGSNTVRLYVNGVMKAKQTDATNIFNSGANFAIGALGSGELGFNGWLDEIRITRGVARYASDAGFVVPTEAFPRS